ncbi:MAG: serine hydrolase domain-containing protein [Candidatus Thorarchaeota archaeon]
MKKDHIARTLREAILEAMSGPGPTGLAMTVVTDDEILWTEVFGHLDGTKVREVDKETLFSLQSTSKIINALAFMFAIQEGLIDLDDYLIEYFPEFKVKSRWGSDEGNKIVFRHLLSHQSGLPRMTRIGGCCDNSSHTFREHIHSIRDTWLESQVGSKFEYSNIGMDLVSYSIEQASGKSFPEFVDDVLAKPLGITITYGSIEAKKNPNRVIGHEHPEIPIDIGTVHSYGCGGAWMNISDLAILTRFLLNNGKHNGTQILQENLIEQIFASQIDSDEGYTYGFGSFIIQGGNVRIVEHAGGGFGYAGILAIAPEHGVGAVVEMNMENVDLSYKLVFQAIDLALKEKGIERKVPTKDDLIGSTEEVAADTLSKLEGLYNGVWGAVRFKVRDSKLFIVVGGNEQEMTPESNSTFISEGFPSVARFVMDDKLNVPVKVTLLSGRVGPVDLFYQESEVIEGVLDDRELESLTGLYRARYYGIHMYHIAVKVVDGSLVYKEWGSPNSLFPYKGEQNTFFTSEGVHYEFGKDHFRYSNRLATRVHDPVGDIEEVMRTGYPKPLLSDWVMDQEAGLLDFLGREEEAEMVRELRSKVHSK